KDHDLKQLTEVPPKSKWPKRMGWIIPLTIVALVVATFLQNADAGWQQMQSWLIWNGSFAGVGALIALGHPLAILTAILAAPITSLNPFMAAGIFAGLVQAYFKKP